MRRILTAAALAVLVAFPAQAQLMDVLTAPKTLIDRAIEARSAGDIAKDNELATLMGTKAQARLVGTAGVADVNFRTTADAFATVYIIGRARSGEEAKKALARVRNGNGVKKVVDYTVVRP